MPHRFLKSYYIFFKIERSATPWWLVVVSNNWVSECSRCTFLYPPKNIWKTMGHRNSIPGVLERKGRKDGFTHRIAGIVFMNQFPYGARCFPVVNLKTNDTRNISTHQRFCCNQCCLVVLDTVFHPWWHKLKGGECVDVRNGMRVWQNVSSCKCVSVKSSNSVCTCKMLVWKASISSPATLPAKRTQTTHSSTSKGWLQTTIDVVVKLFYIANGNL